MTHTKSCSVRRIPMLLAMLAAACTGDGGMSAPDDSPVRFQLSNDLLAPVTIYVDGAPYAALASGRSTALTVSSAARSLTWTSAKPTDAGGHPIPDDIGEITIPLSGIGTSVEISNIINGDTFITASVFNYTNTPVSIAVADGATVSCAGALPAAAGGARGFVQIGYYRLHPTTEVRAYLEASHCTGSYVFWSAPQLAGFAAKSGLLTLVLDVAPAS